MKSFALAVAAASAIGAPGQAATLRLDATTTNATQFTSFWLTFNDTDNDGMFGVGELATFSGMTYVPFQAFPVGAIVSIILIPNIAGIADGGSANWQFLSTGAIGAGPSQWTYAISEVPSSVPLPASGLLLAGTAVAFGLSRRRPAA